jgi:hypothetical protein
MTSAAANVSPLRANGRVVAGLSRNAKLYLR